MHWTPGNGPKIPTTAYQILGSIPAAGLAPKRARPGGRRFNGAVRLHDGSVSVAEGDGVVARKSATILLVSGRRPGSRDPLTDRLVNLVMGPERLFGPDLVRRTSDLIAQVASEDRPSLGLITPSDEAVLVLLAGDVRLEVDVAGSTELHHGAEGKTYVELTLPDDLTGLRMYAGEPTQVDSRSNLISGVVRGNGFVVRSPAAETVPPFVAISLFDDGPAALTRSGDDSNPTASVAGAGGSGEVVQVRGTVCARGHFTDPASSSCVRCGIDMIGPPEPFLGPRPSLGTLVSDQGEEFVLSRDQVLGRDPASAEDVVSGRAMAIVLDDPHLSASRVHARVILDGWEVRVEDAFSGNGTFVAAPGRQWERLTPGSPVTIEPDSRIAVGSRHLTFRAPDPDSLSARPVHASGMLVMS